MKITYAIMLGVFMGIVPIWGYQMLATLFLAHVLKLSNVSPEEFPAITPG